MPNSPEINGTGESKSDYIGTTKSELDHYYGNCIGNILLLFQLREENPNEQINPQQYSDALKGFRDGLQRTLDDIEQSKIRLHKDVSRDLIKEFIGLADQIKDPANEEEISQIVQKYEEVTKPQEN